MQRCKNRRKDDQLLKLDTDATCKYVNVETLKDITQDVHHKDHAIYHAQGLKNQLETVFQLLDREFLKQGKSSTKLLYKEELKRVFRFLMDTDPCKANPAEAFHPHDLLNFTSPRFRKLDCENLLMPYLTDKKRGAASRQLSTNATIKLVRGLRSFYQSEKVERQMTVENNARTINFYDRQIRCLQDIGSQTSRDAARAAVQRNSDDAIQRLERRDIELASAFQESYRDSSYHSRVQDVYASLNVSDLQSAKRIIKHHGVAFFRNPLMLEILIDSQGN
jgi:hypothetical protein